MEQERVIRFLIRERAKLLAYGWSILRDEHAAEDIFQEVTILAVEKREEIENEAALMSWARTATRYRALHALRDNKKTPQPLSDNVLDALDECWAQHDKRESSELVEALNGCVSQLSPYAQLIVSLRYGEGLSGKKVAHNLQRKAKTIYMALTRIHNALRDCIHLKTSSETST